MMKHHPVDILADLAISNGERQRSAPDPIDNDFLATVYFSPT
jgi:hypothetical protein